MLRDRLVQLRIRQMVLRHLTAYLQVKAKGGDGAAASVLKLAMAQLVQESALVAVEAAGMHAIAWTADDPDGGRWSDQLLSSQSASIGGGTNQIVRNVIAERVLGLPRDEEGDLMPGDLDRAVGILATPGRGRQRRRRRAQERLVATEHPPAPHPPGSQAQVLSGLRVVEIGQYVAAPLAATIFADLGAQVVKVERPGGDPLRADPARFAAWNRGKETVELDLRSPAGADALRDLVDEADLLVENLRPGALDRLGLAPATLRAGRPRLVTCSITAWGSDGPSRDEPGWEPLVQARAGAQQGLFTGDDPIWLPFPVASVSAALVAVLGAGAALIKRASTGYGQHVETSLLDALLFFNAAAIFHREGHRPRIVRQTKSPILRVFDTSDGRAVMVNLSGTERWRELCRLLGMDDGGLDYSTPEGLSKLVRPRVEPCHARRASLRASDPGRPTSGRRRCWPSPPPSPSATRWPSGWRASRLASTTSSQTSMTRSSGGCRWSARRCGSPSGPASGGPAAGTAGSRARSAATASSTSPRSGPGRWRHAFWPSWAPTS